MYHSVKWTPTTHGASDDQSECVNPKQLLLEEKEDNFSILLRPQHWLAGIMAAAVLWSNTCKQCGTGATLVNNVELEQHS